MSIQDGINPPQSSIILPFPVKNQPSQLSIKIDDADIGYLYEEYYSMVFNRCFEMLGNREAAQDAAHDIFKQLQELKSKGQLKIPYPKTYLNTAAKNMGINKKKRARRELNEIYDMATNRNLNWFLNNKENGQEQWEIGIIDNGYDQVEAEMIVKAILEEQDETTRKIYFYKFRDDMTFEQIGEILNLSKPAVHKRLKKLEKQVRSKMGKADK
jgi:RNA polymerase sigma-70 factor (ECF subfamily)